jgi:hypothetical protein
MANKGNLVVPGLFFCNSTIEVVLMKDQGHQTDLEPLIEGGISC